MAQFIAEARWLKEATLKMYIVTFYSYWAGTAAINQIDILGNFADGSTFAVYGIAG